MVVLDTNILVAALWSRRGSSFRIVQEALLGNLQIAVSVALALEYEDVLKRAAMREASWASDGELDMVLDALLNVARRIQPIRLQGRPLLADPDDDMVLECALQANADAIVTMNVRDFASAKRRFGIDILKPGDFLARFMGFEG